jgi:hypothetical protein
MTKIDETALEAAAKTHNLGYAERAMFRMVLETYLAALPEPEGIPVRVCVAVGKSNDGADVYNVAGWTGGSDDDLRDVAVDLASGVDAQYRWLNGTVRPWQEPEEPETVGRELLP